MVTAAASKPGAAEVDDDQDDALSIAWGEGDNADSREAGSERLE